MSQPQDDVSGKGTDYLRGLEGAVGVGFAAFLGGLALQSLATIAGVGGAITPAIAGVTTLAGAAYGFAKGANAI